MKLKFINLLLASVLLVGSAQVLTSCKDNEADLWSNQKEETISLKLRLDQDEAKLKDLETALNKEIQDRIKDVTDLKDKIAKLEKEIADLKEDLKKNYATKAELEAVKKALEAKDKELADAISKLETKIADIMKLIDALQKTQAAQGEKIDQIEKNITNITNQITTILGDITDIQNDITEFKKVFNEFKDQTIEDIKALKESVGKLETSVEGLDGRVTTLEGKVTTIEATLLSVQNTLNDLTERVETLESFVNEWKPLLPEIMKNAQDALDMATNNAIEIEALKAALALCATKEELAAAREELQSQINDILEQLGKKADLEDLEALKQLLEEELESTAAALREEMRDYYEQSIFYTMFVCSGLRKYVDENFATTQYVQDELARLEQAITDGDLNVMDILRSEMELVYADLVDQINATNDKISDLDGKVTVIAEDLKTLSDNYNRLYVKVAALDLRVKDLEGALDAIKDRIEEVASRVNGIILQQTDNAVFGTLNLPFGVNSMMAIAWVGRAADDVKFPATSSKGVLNGDPCITTAELNAILNGSRLVLEADDYIIARPGNDLTSKEGVLGTVYMTVNPANVDLDGKTFDVVTSTGKTVPVTINPVASDKELNFGYTRAAANGFYESEVLIHENNSFADGVYLKIDPQLRKEVGAILKDRSLLKQGSTIATLAKAVYSQINGILPALGIQVSWTESNGEALTVTSQYGLAVATLPSLKFTHLAAVDGKLPQIPALPNLGNLKDRFDVWFDDIKGMINIKLYDPAHPFTIDLGDGKFFVEPIINLPTDVTVTATNITVTCNVYDQVTGDLIGKGETTLEEINAKGSLAAVQAALDEAFGPYVQNGNDKLAELCANISKSINETLASMQTNINDTIENVLNNIQKDLDGKIESVENRISGYLNRVQSIIDRINKVLAEPSHYVMPVLFCKDANGGIHMVSEVEALPTVATGTGITLVPTTYTLETAVPLYQKFVAVTKAYANGDASKTNVESVRKAANSTGHMAEVVAAQRHTLGMKLQSGYTYEIVYQAMDYSGTIVANKYYVTVK